MMFHRLVNVSRSVVRTGAVNGACVGIVALAGASAALAKTGSTYYTPGKVRAMRRNVEKYDWAKHRRDQAVKKADHYLDEYGGLEGLWKLVTPQTLPRSYGVNQKVGSPVSGKKIFKKYGFYPWEKGDKPWKLVDPISKTVFPTNDFEAYYQSGLDAHGVFRPDQADKSLLVNKLYPKKGKKWGVDDGFGWINKKGQKFTFIAYYNHWFVWRHGIYGDLLPAFRDAYLFTGEVKYARAGLVLLDRVADVYPQMSTRPYKKSQGFLNSGGGTGQGKVLGSIWATGPAQNMPAAYDAFYPAADDPKLIDFLSRKARQEKLGDRSSAKAIRRHIEKDLVRQVLPGVKHAQIRGNFGMHQAALAMSAVVADDPKGYTRRALDFLFQAGDLVQRGPHGKHEVTGGDVMPHVVGRVDRDGHNFEASPRYNRLAVKNLAKVADDLAGYRGYQGADLYQNVKFKQMFRGRIPLLMIGRYYPHIGDAGNVGNPGLPVNLDRMVLAFSHWRDPIFAQAAYLANDNSVKGIRGDITSEDPQKLADQIQKVIDQQGPLQLPSTNLAGYGLAALRDGKDEARRAAWMYYGRSNVSHAHRDTLNLGYFGFGLDLLPDLGYPERTGHWPKRRNWTDATVSHNTVTVDARQQHDQWVATPLHFDAGGLVRLMDVQAPKVYPETRVYRRTTAMIRVDDQSSYLVDVFRVRGGDDHVFSFHAADGTIDTQGLSLTPQNKGTYAGPDVPMPPYGKNTPYNKKGGWPNQGFNYLHDVRRDNHPADRFAVDWRVKDDWGAVGKKGAMTNVHLRLTMLGKYDQAALALGDPPAHPHSPKSLNYLLVRRTGSHLSTAFTSVIEPYRDKRIIRSIQAVPVRGPDAAMARAVKITLADGTTDYVASGLDPRAGYTVEGVMRFKGCFAFLRLDPQGRPLAARLVDGTTLTRLGEGAHDSGPRKLIDQPRGRLMGQVVSFTRGLKFDNHLTVNLPDASPDQLTNRWIYVHTDGKRNGAYHILAAQSVGQDKLKLDLGETTLVRKLADPKKPGGGYTYNIKPGAACRVPLEARWSKP